MEMLSIKTQLKEEKKFKNATVFTVQNQPKTSVVEATSTYIPIEEFKEIFNYIGELAVKEKITKLIFDKRRIVVFHQPSMEWYFTEWKDKMFDIGLVIHRKILPADDMFRQSVKIGREKIIANYPNGKYKNMDIAYAESIEDAIAF